MCNVCYGIEDCPVCGTDEDYEKELDDLLNKADDDNQTQKDNKDD